MKREIPIALTVICGLLITWAFFSPSELSQAVNVELTAWASIFFAVAFLLGIGNLVRISLKQISARHPDWPYKALLMLMLFGYLSIGLLEIHGVIESEYGDKAYQDWIYERIFKPLQSTMFALLAFYIASAAFRAFRARSMEATLLLTAGALVMLGQVPLPIAPPEVGAFFARVQGFLMAYVNAAGQSAIIMGAALGTLATGLRIVLGLERSYLSE
ncbi:MAG: hypothetical protein DHS20C15_06080 [Planctomycetota bacterium]|nr:MAG: hypothetical protein DHS20C15_06080 [Planctomycetota bacterium]